MMSQAQGTQILKSFRSKISASNLLAMFLVAMQTLGPQGLGDYALLACELERAGKHYNVGDLNYLDFGIVATTTEMTIRITRLRELHRLRELARLGERLAEMPLKLERSPICSSWI